MSRKENTTYRDTRRCSNCHWVDFRDFGTMRGHYCTLFEHRCSKTKVCDDHITEDEHERATDWSAVVRFFDDIEIKRKL